MKIALDYDKTFTADPGLWRTFVHFAKQFGHEVRIVTYRDPIKDNIDEKVHPIKVIYTDGIAKRFYCLWFADDKKGWMPDVWIDDRPETAWENSKATPEILENWRNSPEYNA